MARKDIAGLKVDTVLADFIAKEAIADTGVELDAIWQGLAGLVRDLAPRNKALLARRDDLQAKIDQWHKARAGKPHDQAAYVAFLKEIGYLLPAPAAKPVLTSKVY